MSRLGQIEGPAESLYSLVVRCSFRPSVRCQICDHDILKMNERISMQIGPSGLLGKGMKRSTFGVKRPKIKVTRHQNSSQLENLIDQRGRE